MTRSRIRRLLPILLLLGAVGPAHADDLFVGGPSTLIQRADPVSGGFELVGACGGQVHSMVADGDDLLIGDLTGRVYRYDASVPLLTYHFDAGNDATAMVMDGTSVLIGGSDGTVWRHDRATGAALETLNAPVPIEAMVRLGSTLYVGSSFGVVLKTDLSDGLFEFFGTCGGPIRSMVQHAGHLVLGTAGVVYRIDLDTGLVSETFGIGNDATAMVLHAGDLLSSGSDGSLLRVSPVDGTPAGATLDAGQDVQAMALAGLPNPGVGYCYGTACPCGNDDPEAGCANSTGEGSLLGGRGTPSVAHDDLVLRATGLPQHQFALFYMGATTIAVPFGDGKLCAGAGGYGNFRFLPVMNSRSAGELSLGPGLARHAHLNFGVTGQISAGFTWHFQLWYRDPAGPCGRFFNLSNGYSVTYMP